VSWSVEELRKAERIVVRQTGDRNHPLAREIRNRVAAIQDPDFERKGQLTEVEEEDRARRDREAFQVNEITSDAGLARLQDALRGLK
jgi:hypothetical protein